MPWDESLINSLPTKDPHPSEGRILSYPEAVREALEVAMASHPEVLVFGQGVDDPAAMFGCSKGLREKFGNARVFDTPVSEEGMTGIAVGAALSGMRPVYMHNRPDFLLLTFNQLVTHAGKFRYIGNGEHQVPMVVWSAIGRGWGTGAQHSQSVYGLLLGAPGIKIVVPSTPYDAKGLMLSAIADPEPVLIFEHRWLMKRKGVVPPGDYRVPIGKGVYRKRGTDLTIAGLSHTLDLALLAAEKLETAKGLSVEVIDLRSAKPLDEEIVLESVRKTGKLLIADNAWQMGGLSAELGCRIAEKGFTFLKAPIRRIAFPDIPTPAGHVLESFFYPNQETIEKAILDMCL